MKLDWTNPMIWAAGVFLLAPLYWGGRYARMRYYVWQLKRRQKAAAKVMAQRGGRTWPL